MNRILLLVITLASFAGVTAAYSSSFSIRVIDEHNNGVYSRIYYDDGTQPRPFLKTDQKGEVPDPPRTCGKMRTLYAHPFDSGSYFDSLEEPCKPPNVVLHVVSRQTPSGKAISYKIISFILPDGSPGVLTLKAALESTSSDTSKVRQTPQCEVKFNAIADQHVFKVEGNNWITLKQGTTAFSNAFAGSLQPDTQTITLPYACDAAGGRVLSLQSGAADRLDKSVTNSAVMMNETLRSLGLEQAR
jgi:hypothetical protein